MSPVPLRDEFDVERIRLRAASVLGRWVASRGAGVPLAVGECLPVFTFAVAPSRHLDVDAWLGAMRWEGRWHVQVTHDGRAVGYARLLETAEDVAITSWSRDVLAKIIERALEATDALLPGDTHVGVVLEARPLDVSLLVAVPRDEGTVYTVPLRLPRSRASAALATPIPASAILEYLRTVAPIRAVVRG